MSTLSPHLLLVLVPMAAAGEESGLAGAIGIGAAVLTFLLLLIFGVVAFGSGRDHS